MSTTINDRVDTVAAARLQMIRDAEAICATLKIGDHIDDQAKALFETLGWDRRAINRAIEHCESRRIAIAAIGSHTQRQAVIDRQAAAHSDTVTTRLTEIAANIAALQAEAGKLRHEQLAADSALKLQNKHLSQLRRWVAGEYLQPVLRSVEEIKSRWSSAREQRASRLGYLDDLARLDPQQNLDHRDRAIEIAQKSLSTRSGDFDVEAWKKVLEQHLPEQEEIQQQLEEINQLEAAELAEAWESLDPHFAHLIPD